MADAKPKHPYMPIRDGAGSFDLDNPDDGTPIVEMLSLKSRLLVVTERCTYEIKLADQIDPDRTNPSLPHNVRRKLLDHGTSSDPLRKILLQSKALFRDGFLSIDLDAALNFAVEALVEFEAMERSLIEFEKLESAAVEVYERTKQQSRSISIPTVGGVEAHCKTYAQRAHHFTKILLSLAKLFFPTAGNWDKLCEIARTSYGAEDQFTQFATAIGPTMQLVLGLRDCLDHRLDGIKVRDFSLESDGSVAPPTIEMKFRKSSLPRSSISHLMRELSQTLLIHYQMAIVHMCSKAAKPIAGMQTFVVELPEEDQRARYVRFGYAAVTPDGQFMPFVG